MLTTQVFVANPNKSIAVQRILISNREKLLRFLPSFLDDRTEDEQFIDEKSFLIRQIEQLPSQPIPPPAAGINLLSFLLFFPPPSCCSAMTFRLAARTLIFSLMRSFSSSGAVWTAVLVRGWTSSMCRSMSVAAARRFLALFPDILGSAQG